MALMGLIGPACIPWGFHSHSCTWLRVPDNPAGAVTRCPCGAVGCCSPALPQPCPAWPQALLHQAQPAVQRPGLASGLHELGWWSGLWAGPGLSPQTCPAHLAGLSPGCVIMLSSWSLRVLLALAAADMALSFPCFQGWAELLILSLQSAGPVFQNI